MANFQISYAKSFEKNYSKLTDKEQKMVNKKIAILLKNPFHNSLRTKKIKGTEIFECSVNMNIRILWRYDGENIIMLLDIGHHDILNRF